MNIIEQLAGYIAFFTSFVGFIPQIIKSIKTKSTEDLSMLMLLNYLICSLAWIVYGHYTNSFFVISSNIIGLFTSAILIFQKKYYDSKNA